ncbi:hypothetical protein L1887_38464 [Cichorium endivia]|nr:hypothetical protein L1887_38464 [Cichorium endivia]
MLSRKSEMGITNTYKSESYNRKLQSEAVIGNQKAVIESDIVVVSKKSKLLKLAHRKAVIGSEVVASIEIVDAVPNELQSGIVEAVGKELQSAAMRRVLEKEVRHSSISMAAARLELIPKSISVLVIGARGFVETHCSLALKKRGDG